MSDVLRCGAICALALKSKLVAQYLLAVGSLAKVKILPEVIQLEIKLIRIKERN